MVDTECISGWPKLTETILKKNNKTDRVVLSYDNLTS